jgi:uncharacterized protein (DUF2062 family)
VIKKKITGSLLGFLKQGVSPDSLALAITAGVVVAYIPVFGISTLVCLLVIWALRLNPAVVLLANQVAYPLQFVFFIPFLRTGEWLFGATGVQSFPGSVSQIFEMARENFWNVISLLWQSTLYGLVVWLIVSIPISLILYFLLKTLIARFNGPAISGTS